ncbi:MAG: ABC transporter substrate-binding protein [Longimicrobiales bacterium]
MMIHRPGPVLPSAFLAAALLYGCGADAPGAGDDLFCAEAEARVDAFLSGFDTPTDAQYGGTAVVSASQDLSAGMNAFDASGFMSLQFQQFAMLMTLVRLNDDLEYEPYLASAWELSPDRTELTFTLRDDVRWHDGEPTTAEDVAFTYRRATDPRTGFPNSQYWTYYEGVEVLGTYTVRFRLRPHADILDPWRTLAIMPRHLLGDVPPAELKNHPFGQRCPVGNGPFRFVDHADGQQWTFEANPAFPPDLGGRPFLDRLVYRVIPEKSTVLTELLTGGVDVYLEVIPQHAEQIQRAEGRRLVSFEGRSYAYITWKLSDNRFSDVTVRKAFAHAIDRQGLVDAIMDGYGIVANTSVAPYHWAYDPDVDLLPYDPALARRLLDQAGWVDTDGDGVRDRDGQRLAFEIKTNEGSRLKADALDVIQSQLGAVGVDVTTRVVEFGTFIQQLIDRDFEAAIGSWVTDFKLDDWTTFHSDADTAQYGWGSIDDDELATYLDTLMLVPDREEAQPLWSAYQRRLAELQPYTFLYFDDRLLGINTRLRDVVADVRGDFVNLPEWWIPADERRLRSR